MHTSSIATMLRKVLAALGILIASSDTKGITMHQRYISLRRIVGPARAFRLTWRV